jgi:hypothetical protein
MKKHQNSKKNRDEKTQTKKVENPKKRESRHHVAIDEGQRNLKKI